MIERHVRVTRTARIQLLGSTGPHVREAWFVCHGYGQLASELAGQLRVLESNDRVIVVPEALSRFYMDPLDRKAQDRRVGAAWMTREDRDAEIADYVAYLDAVYESVMAELPKTGVYVHVLGFSQGVATAMRWVALGAARVDALTIWAGSMPDELDAATLSARLGRLDVTLVVGDRDRVIGASALAAAVERLQAAGVAHRIVRFSGGHRLDDGALREISVRR